MSGLFQGPQHEGIRRALSALAPALDRVFVIGGVAHALYRLHAEACPIPTEPLSTADLDLLLPEDGLSVVSSPSVDLVGRLRDHGFAEKVTGGYGDGHVVFEFSGPPPFQVEFLVHRLAGSRSRKGERVCAKGQEDGIHALPLAHLRLLSKDVWKVEVDVGEDVLPVRIPNPVAFVVQKLRVWREREPSRQAKDIVYLYDTLSLFQAVWDRLCEQYTPSLASVLGAPRGKGARAVRRMADVLADPEADPLLRALEVIESSGRAPIQLGATSLAASLRAGFEPLLRHLESES